MVVSLLLLVDVSDVGREDAGAGVQEAVAELGEGEAAEPSSTSMGNLPTNITYNNNHKQAAIIIASHIQ